MAQCINHPDREAIAVCSMCNAPICGECIAPGDGEPVCFECSITMAGQEAGKETSPVVPPGPESTATARSALSPGIKVVLAIGIIVILGELAVILFVGSSSPGAGNAPPALGPNKSAVLGTVAETIVVDQAIQSYKAVHGHYPSDLSEIADSVPGPLRQLIDDPSTRYSTDANGGYQLELKGNAPQPVVIGSDVRAPVPKEPQTKEVTP